MIYVLYHDKCNDGFTAAFIAYMNLGELGVQYIPCQYDQPIPVVDPRKEDEVYILDFSYRRDTLQWLNNLVSKLVVIDHHKTAAEELEDLPYCLFDETKCGARLTWEYFANERRSNVKIIPPFVMYIEDLDLWQNKLPQSRKFKAALNRYPKTFVVWDTIFHEVNHLIDEGSLLCQMVDAQVDQIVSEHFGMIIQTHKAVSGPIDSTAASTAFVKIEESTSTFGSVVDIKGESCYERHNVPVCCTPLHQTEVTDRLLKMYPDARMAACFFVRKDRKVQVRLTSRSDFDCSEVAKMFGGGGHKQAAGFCLTDMH